MHSAAKPVADGEVDLQNTGDSPLRPHYWGEGGGDNQGNVGIHEEVEVPMEEWDPMEEVVHHVEEPPYYVEVLQVLQEVLLGVDSLPVVGSQGIHEGVGEARSPVGVDTKVASFVVAEAAHTRDGVLDVNVAAPSH